MVKLERRRLGRTEMNPKSLGLGCAFLGSPHRTTEEEAIATIRLGIELGIDFVDTAAGYGGGESERRVGLALEGGWRENVYLQTKVGSHPKQLHNFSGEATRWSIENSLKLLKTEYLDSVLIHDPPDAQSFLKSGQAIDVLLGMKEEGIIGHLGVGVREHEIHREAIESGEIDIVLSFLDYTLLSQSVAKTSMPLARKHDVGVILASVQGMGLLAGPEPDHETERRRYPEEEPRAHRIWKWCCNQGVNIRHLALQFCLAAPLEGNGIVLAGPANRQELGEVYNAATTVVPLEVWRAFKDEFGFLPENGMDDLG